MASQHQKELWGPLLALVQILTTALLALTVLSVPLVVFGDGSAFGIGDDQLCVTAGNLSFNDGVEDSYPSVDKGVSIAPDSTTLCRDKNGAGDVLLDVMAQAPPFLLFLGFLLGMRRLMTRSFDEGLFTLQLARRMITLGRALSIGIFVVAATVWLAEGLILRTMTDDETWTSGTFFLSVPALIGAVGLVSFGGVMARAAALQDDADATI